MSSVSKENDVKRMMSAFGVFARKGFRENFLQAFPFWIASVITGLVAVGYTMLFNWSETALVNMLDGRKWLVFILTPVCLLAGWLVVRAVAPGARGSGIPQVMAALDLSTPGYQRAVTRLLSLRIIVIKIASSLLMVLGGAAIGREGPTIQISASIFRLVHRLIPASWPRLADQSFLITGAAAGLAAAFNTPLGGIVFAIEELARIHIRFFRTALFSAVIIAGLTAQGLLGSYLYLGFPAIKGLSPFIFLGVAGAAIAAGLLGSAMCRIILAIARWKQTFSTIQTIVFIIATGLAIASVAYFVNGQILGSGKELMNETLFSSHKHVSWDTMAARIIGPILAFNTGASGGIFAPSLAAGAAVGSFVSALTGFAGANANMLILSGMVGFLTGVTRTPFTSAILVLEMTDRHSVIFHLMLAALLSNMAAMLINKHSLYEQLKSGFMAEAKQHIADK